MPPPSPPSPSDLWLQQKFAYYYRHHPPQVPDRFGKREYAFLFFGQKFMLRHLGFTTREEFERFHRERGPAHSYYSTAYYQTPEAPTMAEKGWLAAELIFDLDADHVPGSEKLPYPQQLEKVKHHFVRLVDDFIRRDFGFEERDLLLTFSGGRGYHCHVLAEKALELTSQERREIVDYVTGTGLDLDLFVKASTLEGEGAPGLRKTRKTVRVPSSTMPGWGRRVNEGLSRYFLNLKGLEEAQLEEALEKVPGLGEKGREQIKRQLPLLTEQHMSGGYFDRGAAFRTLIDHAVKEQVVPLAKGETDEPVTSDTKRLIRTPGSLHGKSGLRVVTLTRDDLAGFDPLTDAVAFEEDPVAIEVDKPLTVDLQHAGLKLDRGKQKVPAWAAVFAVARGAASPIQDS